MDNKNNVFDLEKALSQVGGDRDMLKEIIAIYGDEYPKQLQQIQEARERNDAVTVAQVAHTIKGAVGNFGAQATFEAALNLEKIAKSGNISEAGRAFEVLKTELERLNRELKKITSR